MKRRGFTLIELLAVIIIIAIVAIIATPITLNVIDDVRKEARYQTAVGLIDGAKNYYAESWLDSNKKQNINNLTNIYDLIDVNGVKPQDGELYVNKNGEIALTVKIDGICYKKGMYEELVEFEDENCEVGYVGVDEKAPKVEFSINGITGNNGWYKKESPVVTINVTDEESGVLNYKWCVGTNCEPNEVVTSTGKQVSVLDSESTQVCVIAYDKAENASKKICSDTLKVDTQGPSITGITDVVITKDSEIDLRNGVALNDTLSGVEGTFSVNPEIVVTSKTGTTEVKYTAVDKAGNETTQTINVVVSADAPKIEYIVNEGIINSNGWAKENFFVTIKVTDNTGHGLKEFSICTGVTDRCEPSMGSTIEVENAAAVATTSREILNESDNNRICVQAVDQTGQTSAVMCSTPYKLDKTKPVAGTISIEQEIGQNDWYTENITISPVNGSDERSGHLCRQSQKA